MSPATDRFLGNDEGFRHGAANRTQLGVALQVRASLRAHATRAVTLWLAQLNEVFSGQLLDQTFQF